MAWQPQPGHYDSPYSNATPDPPPPPMNGLNGFTDHKEHNLDDDAFGASGGIVSAFDAFRKGTLSHSPPPPPPKSMQTREEPRLTPVSLQQNRNPNT